MIPPPAERSDSVRQPAESGRGSKDAELAHVIVVGAGQMGAGIAQVVAMAGHRVSVTDADPSALPRCLAAIAAGLRRFQRHDDSLEPEQVLERITLVESLVSADLLIEAVVEDQAVKAGIFRAADSALPPAAVLASNTSSISITELAEATCRPDRVIGMHFFNPVPRMKVVEIVPGRRTSPETLHAAVSFVERLSKWPAVVADHPAFVANRILIPMINEAACALDEGVADDETIDRVARLGLNQPMGPLELADLIGLDTCVAILKVLQASRGEGKYAPSPLLTRYVSEGRLGRKTGHGFYRYDSDGARIPD